MRVLKPIQYSGTKVAEPVFRCTRMFTFCPAITDAVEVESKYSPAEASKLPKIASLPLMRRATSMVPEPPNPFTRRYLNLPEYGQITCALDSVPEVIAAALVKA